MSHSFYDEKHVIFHDCYDDDIMVKNKETGLEVNTTIRNLYRYHTVLTDDNRSNVPDNLTHLDNVSLEFIESFLHDYLCYKIQCKMGESDNMNGLKCFISNLSTSGFDMFFYSK